MANGGANGGGEDFDARQAMMKAYQLGGIAKVPSAGDYIEEWLDGSEEKVLIFGHHKLVLDGLEERVQRYFSTRNKGKKKNLKCHMRIDGKLLMKNLSCTKLEFLKLVFTETSIHNISFFAF